ncbi:MAG: hypothetical protein CHACPFDD_04179 [Phycisphaerae bacterium]|nr:hypothetical protein [Phycisphaerae bacterium]
MTLGRGIVLLVATLAVMLTTALLRGEVARLQFQMSELDRQEESLRLRMRESRLELARLKNPAQIRDRVKDLLAPPSAASRPSASPAGPSKAVEPKERDRGRSGDKRGRSGKQPAARKPGG